MNAIAATVTDLFYGPGPWQDHHGGACWLKDAEGWFLVRNLAGMEWSSQFCADPAKVDLLRRNAARIYAAFPLSVPALQAEIGKAYDVASVLSTPITDAAGVAGWTDSVFNASLPLPAIHHTGVLPVGAGAHHYPAPVQEIDYFKLGSFTLWVTDQKGAAHAVVPVAPPGSGDGRVRVTYSAPETGLHAQHVAAAGRGEALVLDASHPLAKQAFSQQG